MYFWIFLENKKSWQWIKNGNFDKFGKRNEKLGNLPKIQRFKFERDSFRSSGGRGVDRLLVIRRRDALIKGRPCYRESRYRESRVYMENRIEWKKKLKNLQPTRTEFFFLHSQHGWEGIDFMWKMTFEIFINSLCFETPWVRKNGIYESVCLSVCL